MRTKGIWPTSPRDALVMSFVEVLDDGRFMNVTKSIDSHPDFVQRPGDVRMLANVAGFIIGPHPSGDANRCVCVQIMDGDLGGWLPASVVSLVTTQAFPISMRRLNSMLKKIPNHRIESELIKQSQGLSAVVVEDKTVVSMEIKKSPLQLVLKLLKDNQPWMVFAILVLILTQFRRK